MAIVRYKMESDFDMMTFTTCTIVELTSRHTADVLTKPRLGDTFPEVLNILIHTLCRDGHCVDYETKERNKETILFIR